MRIDRIEIHRVAMPLIYPFRTAFGNDQTIESVLVKIQSGPFVGWGEAAPWRDPAFGPEWAAGVFLLLKERLAPLLVGREIESGDELQSALRSVKGNHFAKAALDLAWWDLFARGRGEPLWKVLGGRGPTVDVGADFGIMESIDTLIETIADALRAGFKRVKLKYRPGWELDVLTAVRSRFPDATFHVDCNSAYTLDDLAMLRRLDEFGLAMIEQPLAHDDLFDHATLQREIRTPICLDESIVSEDKMRKAIALKSCGRVNIKLGRVGGITNALKILRLCSQAGMPCWVGSMLESAVGMSHNIALATLDNIRYPSDIFPTSRFYREDLAKPEIILSGPSQVTAQPGAGIGVDPDPRQLDKLTVERTECCRSSAAR